MIGCSAAANAIEISDLLIIYIVKKFFLNRYLYEVCSVYYRTFLRLLLLYIWVMVACCARMHGVHCRNLNMKRAIGKGNRMFAAESTTRQTRTLIMVGALLCATVSQAQQPPTEESGQDGNEPSEGRRIERLGDVSTDEWELNLALPGATGPAASGDQFVLPDEEQNQELKSLLSEVAQNPGNSRALSRLRELLADVLTQANAMIDQGSAREAGQLLQLVKSIDPNVTGFKATQARLKSFGEVNGLLAAGDDALDELRILEPENDNALYYFNQAFSRDPANKAAQLGLVKVQRALTGRAVEAARRLDFEIAEQQLYEASTILEDQQAVSEAQVKVDAYKEDRASELEQEAISAMDSGDFNESNRFVIDLIALGGQEGRVDSLRDRLEEARFYGGFEPGQILRDDLLKSGGKAPRIIVIPAGSFLMGTRGGNDNQKPQHRVVINNGFALGVTEVTVQEFAEFIQKTGYRTDAERVGTSSIYNEAAGRLNRREGVNWRHGYTGKKASPEEPVLHVSARDADIYVEWLADETGKRYRLPSEAEYEYVARAGEKNRYWWGQGSPKQAVENLTGERDQSPAKREWTTFFEKYGDGHWGPAPAGSLVSESLAHPMGIHDIAGNVSEWMEDCWHQNYAKAPSDASAWVNPGCSRRVVRGGYWASAPEQTRATFRSSAAPDRHGPVIGFRIARDL
jgi:formylglycine-generating enzyme required for sulfatase activity